jgi:hypothetical protein
MFCKVCQNFMDITNNVSNTNPEEEEEDSKELESSDYDVSNSSKKGKKSNITQITDDIIEKILNGVILDIEVDEQDIIDINKLVFFNKLTPNQKTLVINRLYEKIPKNQKIAKDTPTNLIKLSYFYCKNCGYNEKIPNNMLIFNRSNEKSSDENFNDKFLNFKYDPILPKTKKYNCNNKDCLTHKDPAKKKAIFYRTNNSYTTKYICLVCDSFWSTFIENVNIS